MADLSPDKHGEALKLLKEVEDAIFQATGSALLAGEKCNASDKTVIYKSLCAAGNTVAYVREDLLAPSHVAAIEKARTGFDETAEIPQKAWDGLRSSTLLTRQQAVTLFCEIANRMLHDAEVFNLTENLRAVIHEFACSVPSATRQTDEDTHYNPVTQVYFRAGLLACREYMARFVEPQSPEIAASIRANWWPSLGEDLGAPRKMRWEELTEGEFDTPTFRAKGKGEVSPTLEALPVALAFLESIQPGATTDGKASRYSVSINGHRFDLDIGTLSGEQVRALAVVPDDHQLIVEGSRDQPDRLLKDDDSVDITKGATIYSRPLTNAG